MLGVWSKDKKFAVQACVSAGHVPECEQADAAAPTETAGCVLKLVLDNQVRC